MSKLWKYIEIGGENSRDKLAGNISESFLLTDTKDWFWILYFCPRSSYGV